MSASILQASDPTYYRDLLKDQQAMRLDLHACQEAGLDTSHLFQNAEQRENAGDMRAEFREAAEATTTRMDGGEEREREQRERERNRVWD